ncbi:phosphotransferase family protein [Alkalibacterium pelagium]|uniref:Phosphotransferase enzyme family protein n=1 Tax=Alkalibacterium pelagium TaxID=426702 RepID=A0A1H7NKN6_9LACT|nr:aminoglycoside phosphotransferase family protein [Alkalibacterium pelagium]GEN51449.1 hypothetical protein APE02nite_21140 [Alkalibacterium pelagium]SEL24046.1 Phosphotransferase enzyme family protein [Alkalibacterium pelagium]
MHQTSKQTIQWIEASIDGDVLERETLKGGMSSDLTLLTVKLSDGVVKEMVLREYTDREWLKMEPDIAYKEAENLTLAEKLSVSTPSLIASDSTARQTTWPSLLMSKVEGEVILNRSYTEDWIDELAEALFLIHQATDITCLSSYFRYFDPIIPVQATWSAVPKNWQKMMNYLAHTPVPETTPAFIHRDFHPTNVLFINSKVSAVVDWPNACMGPKQVDIGHCRWNLAMLYGQDAADDFLKAYRKKDPDLAYPPYWDFEMLGNVFTEDKPEVYGGWLAYERTDLTEALLIKRMDSFLHNALDRLNGE